jgi:tripeptide aminopeptidase
MDARFTSPLAEVLAPGLLERFLRYVRVDTQSARNRSGSPSTPGQLELGRMLVDELHAIGLEDAAIDGEGYVIATLPAPDGAGAPVIGLIAHVDTSPDAPGAGVEPLVHRSYDGGPLRLPRGGTVLDPAVMAGLAEKAGHDLVSSSGDTLLGADDKAGVAEIMTALAYLTANPELPRPPLRIAFTPDEEIGEGASLFDVEQFGAACAYTIDGSDLGELQDESFTGSRVTLAVDGVDIHPGLGKDRLVNALRVAAGIVCALPSDGLAPEATEGREGFIHPYALKGSAGHAVVELIVRDFDDAALEEHVELLRRTAQQIVDATPGAGFELEVEHQYPNMRRFIESFPEVVEVAERALRAESLEPVRAPIRGGTDGSVLSSMGLPTPNLFTGGHEYHSVREWASVQDMAAASATIVRLAEEWAGRAG